MYLLLDRQMCDSQCGIYMDVESDEHTASAIPKFCGSSLIDVNGRFEREREREKGKKKKEEATFTRFFLPLIVTICRNFPPMNNHITEIASFFDPVRILNKSWNLRSSIPSQYLSSYRISVIADIRRSCIKIKFRDVYTYTLVLFEAKICFEEADFAALRYDYILIYLFWFYAIASLLWNLIDINFKISA